MQATDGQARGNANLFNSKKSAAAQLAWLREESINWAAWRNSKGIIRLVVVSVVIIGAFGLLGWAITDFSADGSGGSQTAGAVRDLRVFVTMIAAGVAAAALAATFYSHYRTDKLAAITAWKECHDRIGKLYDMAIESEAIYAMLSESPDYTGETKPARPSNGAFQWATNYLMALEQATTCIEVMSVDSRAAWEKHIRSQFCKPTLRAAFFADNVDYGAPEDVKEDPHQSGSWSLALTRLAIRAIPQTRYDQFLQDPRLTEERPGRALWAFLNESLGFLVPSNEAVLEREPLTVLEPLRTVELQEGNAQHKTNYHEQLKNIYDTRDVQRQMFTTDLEWTALSEDRYVLVDAKEQVVSSFTLVVGEGKSRYRAELGFVVAHRYRRQGLSARTIDAARTAAKARGITVLRADVYADNEFSIRAMKRANFRRFEWYELNL